MIGRALIAAALVLPLFAQRSVEGIWLGTLDTGATKLRLALKLSKTPGGGLTGTLDSIDQSADDLPLSGVEQNGAAFRLTLPKAGATYEGVVSADGTSIAGAWKQGGGSLPLTFHRSEKAPALVRPQEPKRPYPYREEEVAYENQPGGAHLAATLTLPPGPGPFPAALLITGSGQQDRNESLMGHKPFLVLADYLTRKGIAVLRADDRGMGGSTGDVVNVTSEDFAGDAQAGVGFLKRRKEIDARKIGLIGHSEGGLIAAMLAARSRDIAFIVMMAGPGVPGAEVSYAQSAALQKAAGVPDAIIVKNLEIEQQVLTIVKQEADPKVREEKLAAIAAEISKRSPARAAALANQFKMAASPWYRFFALYDPAQALAKVTCPVLAMTGSLDVQVPSGANLPAIAKALEAGGNRDYQIVKLPGLNHLFQSAKTGLPGEYSAIEETLAPSALNTIGFWVAFHTHN